MLTAVVAAFGCDASNDDGPFVLYEEGEVLRAVNRAPSPDTIVVANPMIRVGGPEAEGPSVFGSVVQVKALTDGGFLVVDAQGEGSLRRFDASGDFVLEIGGRGDGPGEFNQPYRLLLSGDTVRVWSLMPRRLSVFLVDGTFLRTEPVEKPSAGLPFFRAGDGFLDEREWGQTTDWRPPRAAVLRIVNGIAEDTLVGPYPIPLFGWEIIDEATGTGRMVNPPVFSARPPWTVCDGSLVWGNPDTGEVEFRDLRGRLDRVVELPGGRRPVSDQDRDAFVAAVVEEWGVPPEEVGRLRREMSFAEFAPRLTALLCSSSGQVWVSGFSPSAPRPFDAVGYEWTVLDPDGRTTAHVRFPDGFTLFDLTDDRAYGVRPGEFGVDVVEIYAVILR